ncbi:MAG: glycoside hydrolase family 2 TIM barrel-domain containing protein [Alistipes sp.]
MKRHIITLLLTVLCLSAQARTSYSLNEGWHFFFSYENSSDNARLVTLPHTWNTDAKGGSGPYLRTTANYQNNLFLPAEWAGKRLFIKFYGVQNLANLFVNGYHVGEHRGGGTAFTFEITDKVKLGSDNSLFVVVSNNTENDILPTSTEMNIYGGIYRNVELLVTEQTAISPLYFGSDGVLIHQRNVTAEQVEGEAEVHLITNSNDTNCTLTLTITAPDNRIVFSKNQRIKCDGKPILIPFTVDKPQLWSPSEPTLYRVSARIDSKYTDEVVLKTGFRDIRVTPKTGLLINGKRVAVRGVSLYHDNITAGNALTTADYDADWSVLRELGANALHSAVQPHAQYLYNKCDSAGLLVWIDLPFVRAPFLGDFAYFATPRFRENGRQQLQEIVAQNYNHPSVAMWGIYSLLWTKGDDTTPYIKELNALAHTIDPSRPTVACSNQDGAINFITDLIVWQQDVGWERGTSEDIKVWQDLLRKKWGQLRSGVCYGGVGFPGHHSFEAKATLRPNWMPENRQTQFHEEYAKNIDGDSLFWGVWVNNLFDFASARTPYGINGMGLVSFDRRDYKDAFYLYKSLWNKAIPTLHITDKRRTLRENEVQRIKIYSSAGAPILRINRDTVRVTEYAPCQYLSDTVVMNGKYRIEAEAGSLSDCMEVTVGNILKPKRNSVPLRKVNPVPTN